MNRQRWATAKIITPKVQQWLQKPTAVSLLHLFDHAINLIDEAGEIVSIVQPTIGAGPFAVVVDGKRPFPSYISPQALVHKTANSLAVGQLQIDIQQATVWNPTPPWALLCEQKASWLTMLPHLQTAVHQAQDRLIQGSPAHFVAAFNAATKAVETATTQQSKSGLTTAVAQLAGLGPGLTPAGDDYLLGWLYGVWATQPEGEVVELAKIVQETAVPRTTQLSAAWLKAAAQGEAAIPWHHLTKALLMDDDWKRPFNQILNTGATSGIAALMGFVAGVIR